MPPAQAVESVLRKYADFSGRAGRSEYWWWWAALFAAFIAIGAVTAVVGWLGSVLAVVVAIGSFVPNLAVTVRRLHDSGRNGWWLFIVFVPIIGAIVLLVFLVLDSEREPNAWGDPPTARAWPDPAV